MKFHVRFENDDGSCSEVGMNNLMIFDDARIKTRQGILKRINDTITQYHPGKTNKVYRVYRISHIRDTAAFLFKGKNNLLYSFKE